MRVEEHPALFSLLGATYGGDGKNTFCLPSMTRVVTDDPVDEQIPVHMGVGGGLSPMPFGSTGGARTAALTVANLPEHGHPFLATTAAADQESPKDNLLAKAPNGQLYYSPPVGTVGGAAIAQQDLSGMSVTSAGLAEAFPLGMPTMGVVFIISLQGEFPDISQQP